MFHSTLGLASGISTAAGVTLLLDAVAKGMVVLVAVGMCIIAMRRSSAAMRHLVWAMGLTSLLIVPLISLIGPNWEVLPEWLRTESFLSAIDSWQRAASTTLATDRESPIAWQKALSDLPDDSNVPASGPITKISGSPAAAGTVDHADVAREISAPAWFATGGWIWGTVTAVLVLRIVLSRYILSQMIRTATKIEDGPIHRQIVRTQQFYRIKNTIYGYLSNKRQLPMTWGLFRSNILLPAEAASWPSGRLEAVLLHELAHVKRRDTITHVVGQLACAVHWINPLAWYAAWRIHIERERACDDLVVGSGIKSSDYAEHLLCIVGNCRHQLDVPCSAMAMAKASALEGRLQAILNERLNRKAITRRSYAMVLIAGCVGTIAVATLHAQIPADNAERARLGETIDLVASDDVGVESLGDSESRSVERDLAETEARSDEDPVRISNAATNARRFVRIVAGPDDVMSFEGRATSWEELPAALAEVPHRPDTVLEFAISTEQLTVAQLNDFRFRAATLAKEHGFEYVSYVGVHPLGSKGSPSSFRHDGNASSSDEDVILAEPAKEAFDTVAKLARMSATEVIALDSMLREQPFDAFDGLRTYDPNKFDGDAAALERALQKLFDLERRQESVLKRNENSLSADALSDKERASLEQLQASIRRQHAARVLSIRQVFRPTPASGRRANWSALFETSFENKNYFMAIARSPVGDEFPVQFVGEDTERFRVRLVSGDDDALAVQVSYRPDDRPTEPVEREFRLVRDKEVEFDVNGDRFSLLYPSTFIARAGPATTDLAKLIVSYRPVEQDP